LFRGIIARQTGESEEYALKISETFHALNRAEWRKWLEKNHTTQKEIWLLFFKKEAGKPQVSYDEAVEEALCFGWIDSIIQNIDSERYVRKFTPRKVSSKWSALNKRRVAAMIRAGKMTEAGRAVLNFAGADDDYGRTPERAKNKLVPPPYLERQLKQNRKAWEYFQSLAPSYRRNYIGWITAAKTEETRARRIAEAIILLARNEKLGMK
jgi:uncharacterized protein YdeI (YjbR/CyaY-like superfamily)